MTALPQCLTIALTDHNSVRIKHREWKVIVINVHREVSGLEDPANPLMHVWKLRVRQHADGRAIVYAKYARGTLRDDEPYYCVQGGIMTDAFSSLSAALTHVVDWMRARTPAYDAERWETIRVDCIARLPKVEF